MPAKPAETTIADPEAPKEVPSAPPWLLVAERKLWDYYAPILHKAGLLTYADIDTLARYCRALYQWKGYSVKARKNPVQVAKTGYESPSAWTVLAKQAASDVEKLADALGLSPKSRKNLKTKRAPKKKEPADEGLIA